MGRSLSTARYLQMMHCSSRLQSCNLLIIVVMMMMMITCHTTVQKRDGNATNHTASTKPYVTNQELTRPTEIVRYINATLKLNCSLVDNSTRLVTWRKDGVNLTHRETNKLMIDEHAGWLQFTLLDRNDSGFYTCITKGSTGIREKTILLKVIDKPRMSSPYEGLDVTKVKLSARLYSLPDWMTGVACVVLIAMVTIIIIAAYVKMTTPKKGDLSKRFETPKEELEIEVIPNKPTVDKERGVIRQRKSTSSSPQSSQEDSFLNESPKYCSSRKEKPTEQDLGVGRAPANASQRVVKKNLETEGRALRKIKSAPCNVINKEEKDFASFMAHHLDKNNNLETKRPLKVRSDPELTKNTPEHVKHELNLKTSKKQRSPGKMLRQMACEPYSVSTKHASKSNRTEGQALRKVSSAPAPRRSDTLYSGPIIKPSLGYDKNVLYTKVQKKLKKAKSDISIDKLTTRSIGQGAIITEKSKRRDKTNKQETKLNFSNPFYASIEDISATIIPASETECMTREDDDDDPIYRDINEYRHPSLRVNDSNTSHTRSEGSMVTGRKTQTHEVVKNLKHEKQIENLGFSFSEDLGDFDFDEEPNSVVDRIYEDIYEIDTNYPIMVNFVRELPQLPNDSADEESLYEEIHCSKA